MTGPAQPVTAVGASHTRRSNEPSVFLSYRRRENAHLVGRLSERLVAALGEANVFRDTESIPGAADFVTVIKHRVRTSDVVLAVIGPAWREAPPQGDKDYVHLELRLALELGIPVIPVIIDGATPPASTELPEALTGLTARNAMRIDADQHFRDDTDRLIRAVRELAPPRPRLAEPVSPPPPDARTGRPTATVVSIVVGVLVALGLAVAAFVAHRGDGASSSSGSSPTSASAAPTRPSTTSPANPPTTAAAAVLDQCQLTISNPFATIRSEPEQGSLEAGRVPPGTYVVSDTAVTPFAGIDQRWYQIDAGGQTGWIQDNVVLIEGKGGSCG